MPPEPWPEASADSSIIPAARPDVWRAYLDQSTVGYGIYSVGAVTAFLAVALALTDAEASLHSSSLAAGMVAAGLTSERLDRLCGAKSVHIGALLVIGLAGFLLAWAPALMVTLPAAAAVGVGSGALLGHITRTLSAGGGLLARMQLSRSNLIAMFASVLGPVMIAFGVSSGLGWQLGIAPLIVLVAAATAATVGRAAPEVPTEGHPRHLPSTYWVPWLLAGLAVALEFAVVFWGSTLVHRRTDVPLGQATLTISAYIGGMILGRLALSTRAVSSHDPVRILRSAITLVLAGSTAAWASGSFELSALAMSVGGIGVGVLYPISASLALAAAPGQAAIAAPRLVLVSGLAILLAPLIIGVGADTAGILAAWLLIPVICLAALALTVSLSPSRSTTSA